MTGSLWGLDLEKANHGDLLRPPAAVKPKLRDSAQGDVHCLSPSPPSLCSTRASLTIETLTTLSSDASQCEKEPPEPSPLPPKLGFRLSRWVTHTLLSSYRVLFMIIFGANLVIFIVFFRGGHGPPASTGAGTATAANLMVAFLFRQENFVNLVHDILTRAPHWLPLGFRRILAKVYHYGGLHSGCAVAAVGWYILYTALATWEFQRRRERYSLANMTTAYVLIFLLSAIVASAHPSFRVRFHDSFEAAHRFAGWTALGTFWVQTIFSALSGSRALRLPGERYLITMPSFWCLCVSTFCIVLSWGRLRKRKVVAETLSGHATRLHFSYRPMKPFFVIRISDRPLLEWHGFATIPNEDGQGFSVLVSNAGDWTRRQIQEPSKDLWIRSDPMYGLLCTSRLFKRVIVLATGSGIGPCLSLFQAKSTPCRVLWSTKSPEATYGGEVLNAVFRADPQAMIWDTGRQGRPDLVAVAHRLYSGFDAEAVFVVSNPKVTKKVVYGMTSRGIPAYGPIFDS